MLNVVDAINLHHELLEIKEHLHSIFQVTLGSSVFESMATVLSVQNDQSVAQIKLDILKCLGLLTYGMRIFGKQDSIVIQENTYSMHDTLVQRLMAADLVQHMLNTLQNNYSEIRQQCYVTIGHYLKSGLELRPYLL